MNAPDWLRRFARVASEPDAHFAGQAAQAAGRSHVGTVRSVNEDRFLICSERGLWAVADGMGGHNAGGDAADVAIAELAQLVDADKAMSEAAIEAALSRANRRIHQKALQRRTASGTTVVVAWASRTRLTLFWIGDSRAYLARAGRTTCLTRDHTIVQELIDAGAITQDEARKHPQAHLVTRALGATSDVVPEKRVITAQPGDRILLCSDGITRSLDLDAIPLGIDDIDNLADTILNNAVTSDGSDNATLVAVRFASAAMA